MISIGDSFDGKMTKTCSVAGCKTNYKKRVDGVNIVTHPGTVISFPDEVKNPDLRRQWVRFCNQKSFHITNNSGICTKHFDDKFIKEGADFYYGGAVKILTGT